MKKVFSEIHNISIVSVSDWVGNRACQSPIMGKLNHIVINNGIDTENIFHKSNNHLRQTEPVYVG